MKQKFVPGVGWCSDHGVDVFADIKAFHEKFDLRPVDNQLPLDLFDFRLKFMREELEEYEVAMGEGDYASAMDALLDLIYVAAGTLYLQNFPAAEGWRRVQEANMAKVRAAHAGESKRGSTYDVVKPEGWRAPNHDDLIGDLAKDLPFHEVLGELQSATLPGMEERG